MVSTENGLAFLGMSLGVIVWIFISYWIAKMTNKILINKGYNPNFWIGFIFGPLSWIYCIAIPDLKVQNSLKEIAEKNKDEN